MTDRQILLAKFFLFLNPIIISWIRFKTVVLYGATQTDDRKFDTVIRPYVSCKTHYSGNGESFHCSVDHLSATEYFLHPLGNKFLSCNLSRQFLVMIIFYTLSHLSVHVVNRQLPENRKSIPKYFKGKQLLKKCDPPDFKFSLW